MARLSLVTTGTELTTGRTVDTNAARAARILSPLGLRIVFHVTVGDDRAAIADAVRLACARADVVLVSGGLGPTRDDLTRWALAALARRPLSAHRATAARVLGRTLGGRPPAKNNVLQALVPRGATIFENRWGAAPGFAVRIGRRWCVALPGVPSEFEPMLREAVAPWLARRGLARRPDAERRLTLCGVPESAVDEAIGKMGAQLRGLEIALTVDRGVVRIALSASAAAGGRAAVRRVARVHRGLRRRFGDAVVSASGRSLEASVARALLRRRRTVAIAESCTGGLVTRKLAAVPGISGSLLEGVVSYGNRSKVRRLGVLPRLIRRHGAVSREVAAAMALGAARGAGADIGLSVTGVAGPGGGSARKPVGLVWLGASVNRRARVESRLFRGGRIDIQERAAVAALDLLRRVLADS